MNPSSNANGLVSMVCLVQVILLSAIFGFFYAYSVSVMWGLDLVTPTAAIEAMNGINTAVRNGAFAPSFFGPVVVGAILVLLAWRHTSGRTTLLFLASWVVYVCGGFILTISLNVPMNAEMLALGVPNDPLISQQIWAAYSQEWTNYNHIRTGFAGLSLILGLFGFYRLARHRQPINQRSARPASPAALQSWNLPLL